MAWGMGRGYRVASGGAVVPVLPGAVVEHGACQLPVGYLRYVSVHRSFASCLTGLFVLPLLSFRGSLYILGTNYKTVPHVLYFLRCPM